MTERGPIFKRSPNRFCNNWKREKVHFFYNFRWKIVDGWDRKLPKFERGWVEYLEKVDKEINEINSKEGLEYYLKQNK